MDFQKADPTMFYTLVLGAVLLLALIFSGIVILVNKRRRRADIEYAVADMQEVQRRAEQRDAERAERLKKEEAERRKKERAEARERRAREKAEIAAQNGESQEILPAKKAPSKRRKKPEVEGPAEEVVTEAEAANE